MNLLIAKQKHLMRDMPKYFMCVWLLKQFGSLFLVLKGGRRGYKMRAVKRPIASYKAEEGLFLYGVFILAF